MHKLYHINSSMQVLCLNNISKHQTKKNHHTIADVTYNMTHMEVLSTQQFSLDNNKKNNNWYLKTDSKELNKYL